MPEPLLFLKAMGAAAIVSATSVLALIWVRRSASTTWLNWICALGIGLGLATGYSVLSWRLAWPPANGLDRLLTIVFPATFTIEMIAACRAVPRWVAWSLRACLSAAIPRILLHGSVYLSDFGNGWTPWQTCAVLVSCGALLVGVWGLLSWLSLRSPGVSIPLALAITTQSAGLAVMMAGYIRGGAAAFPVAAAVAATTIGAWLASKRASPPAILGMAVVGLFGLLFIGRFYGRLSTGCAVAMLLAPLMCWTTEVPLLRRRNSWIVGTIRLALVVIPLLAVLALAKRNFDRQMAPLLGKVAAGPSHSTTAGGEIIAGGKTLRTVNRTKKNFFCS